MTMAHSASMGPPLSPRETRRSVRRTAPSISASTSKSPDSDQPPREKQRTTSSSSRNKRLKQEDYDDAPEDQKVAPISSTISSGSNSGVNGKSKRRGKEKEKEKDKQATSNNNSSNNHNNQDTDSASVDLPPIDYNDEDDQGITRCVCGSTEDDPDAGEFMVQCETCKVWQHGLCMGYLSEDQVHDDDYYCELCRPDLHLDLPKKTNRRPARQTSATSRSDHPANSRVSRSHSPSHLSKASKRRNTMNSRDAAFDESLKEIIEATAAEAAAGTDVHPAERTSHPPETDSLKKKRKRSAEDLATKKRTRSASTSSDRQSIPPVSTETPSLPPPPKPTTAKQKRTGGGSNRKPTGSEAPPMELDDANSSTNKRQGNGSRPKASNAPKRPPLSHSISHASATVAQEHAPKRNQASGTHASTAADARAYRNTHAYAVSQQTLFTSWNLPDYLSHLEHILPTDVPQPLEVRSSVGTASANARADSTDRTMERGVKVKWPAKRMSVGDMNKRVRALVEWVGREQANALDRGRRRQALEIALRENPYPEPDGTSDGNAMDVDQPNSVPVKTTTQIYPSLEMSTQTMKMMEELMEELIGFQEKFGPGAKSRDRRINANS